MDCDNLLVLGGGELLEFGPPHELAARRDGTFSRMVAAAKAAQHGNGRAQQEPPQQP